MAGGFAMIAGGIAEGVGNAMTADWKSKKEASLRALELEHQDARDERQMKFQSDQAALDRGFRSGESAADRQFRIGETDRTIAANATEAEKTRQFTGGENKADRDARLKEGEIDRGWRSGESALERDARIQAAEKEFGFRAGESAADRKARLDEGNTDREFRSKEAKTERDWRSGEAAKERDAGGDLVTTEDGQSYVRKGSIAEPLLDKDGKPVKLAGQSSKDAPSEIQTAEWLITQGVAGSAKEAWELVRGARTDPDKSRAGIYKAWLTALTPDMGTVDAAKIQEEAIKRTDEAMKMLETSDSGGGAAPAAADASGNKYPPAPVAEAKRVVGQRYVTATGKVVRWERDPDTGKTGWVAD